MTGAALLLLERLRDLLVIRPNERAQRFVRRRIRRRAACGKRCKRGSDSGRAEEIATSHGTERRRRKLQRVIPSASEESSRISQRAAEVHEFVGAQSCCALIRFESHNGRNKTAPHHGVWCRRQKQWWGRRLDCAPTVANGPT
jgi:hypothetical protein